METCVRALQREDTQHFHVKILSSFANYVTKAHA